MRIAVISPGLVPGAADRLRRHRVVVSLLADGLVDAGHDVTLFASGDSQHARRSSSRCSEIAPSERIGTDVLGAPARAQLLRARRTSSTSSTTTPACCGLDARLRCSTTPLVHTVHGPLDGEPGEIYDADRR